MSVELEGDTQSPQAQGLEAVGKRLASARREQQREVAAVATGLHLRTEVVEALEAGDESALPAMTFVRGYIKTYARLLGLDEQDVLAALPSNDGYRARPLKAVGMRRKQPRRLPLGKGFVWLLVIALLLLLVLYGVPLVEQLMDKANQPVEDNNSLELPFDASPSSSDELSLPAFVNSPEMTELPEEAPMDTAMEEPEEISLTETEETLLPEPVSPRAEVTVAEPVPAAEKPATGPAEISMHFNEDSWVEMESHGRKLVVGTQRAGSQRTVHAEPPIQILLGNAPGVEITYRGKPVDLQRYRRGKVARLVLED